VFVIALSCLLFGDRSNDARVDRQRRKEISRGRDPSDLG